MKIANQYTEEKSAKIALIKSMEVVLANHYALYLKTQNYHWNVTGPHFQQLHVLFEEQYTELTSAIDIIAERIRALDAVAPGSFEAFQKLSSLSENNPKFSGTEMVEDLYKSHQQLIISLKKCLEAAQNASDEVSLGLIIERLTIHEKTSWMLKASLKEKR